MGGGKRLGGWRGEPHVHVVVVVVRHGRRRLAGSPEWRGQGGGRDRGRRSAVWLGGEARPRFFLLTYVSRMALVRPRAADTNLRVGGRSLARSSSSVFSLQEMGSTVAISKLSTRVYWHLGFWIEKTSLKYGFTPFFSGRKMV